MATSFGLRGGSQSAGRKITLGEQTSSGTLADFFASTFSSLMGGEQVAGHNNPDEAHAQARAAAACEVVSRFCTSWTSTRVEPTLSELEQLSEHVRFFRLEALSTALSAQLVVVDSEGEDVEWQRHFRVLHAINFFYIAGGTKWSAAEAAVHECEELIRHLISEVPQCRDIAMNALRIIDGPLEVEAAKNADAPEVFVDAQVTRDCEDESAQVSKIPCALVPRLASPPQAGVLSSDSSLSAFAGTGKGAAVISLDTVSTASTADSVDAFSELTGIRFEVEDPASIPSESFHAPSRTPPSTCFDRANDEAEEAEVDLETTLGFHWLETSRLADAVPQQADPFAFASDALDNFAGL